MTTFKVEDIEDLSDYMLDMIDIIVGQSIGISRNLIENETRKIYMDAKKGWPVRQKRYGRSEGSRNKLKWGLEITPSSVSGFVENLAEYADKIKAGPKSSGSTPEGEYVVGHLIVLPMIAAADKIAIAVGEELIQKIKEIEDPIEMDFDDIPF